MSKDSDPFDFIKWRLAYNATDMGELGTYIRLEYAYNFIEEARKKFTKKGTDDARDNKERHG